MTSRQQKTTQDEWDVLIQEIEALRTQEEFSPMFTSIEDWEKFPSGASDPWDTINTIIDISKKVR